jgi:hypothetical protein
MTRIAGHRHKGEPTIHGNQRPLCQSGWHWRGSLRFNFKFTFVTCRRRSYAQCQWAHYCNSESAFKSSTLAAALRLVVCS